MVLLIKMVFKNEIYSGAPEGFFSYDRFNEYLKSLPNVNESIYDQNHETRFFAHMISEVPIQALYHFRLKEDKVIEHLDVYSITNKKGLGEIETLIIEEAKKNT
jgi:hypothetical protein